MASLYLKIPSHEEPHLTEKNNKMAGKLTDPPRKQTENPRWLVIFMESKPKRGNVRESRGGWRSDRAPIMANASYILLILWLRLSLTDPILQTSSCDWCQYSLPLQDFCTNYPPRATWRCHMCKCWPNYRHCNALLLLWGPIALFWFMNRMSWLQWRLTHGMSGSGIASGLLLQSLQGEWAPSKSRYIERLRV